MENIECLEHDSTDAESNMSLFSWEHTLEYGSWKYSLPLLSLLIVWRYLGHYLCAMLFNMFFLDGLTAIWDSEWIFSGYPESHQPNTLTSLYLIYEISYLLSTAIFLNFEKRNHHKELPVDLFYFVAAIVLVEVGYEYNLYRVALGAILLHEIGDFCLEFAKAVHYLKIGQMNATMKFKIYTYILCPLLYFLARAVLFPLRILIPIQNAPEHIPQRYNTSTFSLMVLILDVVWSIFLWHFAYKALKDLGFVQRLRTRVMGSKNNPGKSGHKRRTSLAVSTTSDHSHTRTHTHTHEVSPSGMSVSSSSVTSSDSLTGNTRTSVKQHED